MKTGTKVKHTENGVSNYDFQSGRSETPLDVMQAVHRQLEKFGLEVINHPTDEDFFAFTIRKIRKPAVEKVKVHPLTEVNKFKVLPAPEAAMVLMEIYKSREHKGNGAQLASALIVSMQDWCELFQCPEIDEIDW